MTAVAIIDVRVLDSERGAAFVKGLEDSRNVHLIFAVEDPDDSTADTLGALDGAPTVVKNTGRLGRGEFWAAVFEFLDNGRNEIVSMVSHYDHWQSVNSATNRGVPFKFVYDPAQQKVVHV